MPIENPEPSSPQEINLPSNKTAVVDLDQAKTKEKDFVFKKNKFYLVFGLLFLLVLASLWASFYLGNQSVKPSTVQIEKKAPDTTAPNVQTVGINEDVTVNSGVTITLEEAKYDPVYESQKQEQLNYYQNNASQSAYLQSDYFKQSNLLVTVNLVNNTKKAVSYNPSSFRLKDSDDVQYSSSGSDGVPPTTVTGLNPDEKTKLNLAYIVPTSQKSFKLIDENAIIEFSIK